MTRPDHPSGTDRIAEVARGLSCDIVVNVQGDEPALDPAAIEAAVAPLIADASVVMGTTRRAARPTRGSAEPEHRQGARGPATGSRSISRARRSPTAASRARPRGAALRHIGLYVYRRDFLLTLASLPRTPLERIESLEQLRALEHGLPDQGGGNPLHLRLASIRPRTSSASAAWRPTVCSRESRHATKRTELREVHLRHRRRGVVARQGAGGGVDRLPARGARLQGHAPEARPLHQRRPRHDEPVPARRGLRHRRRRRDRPGPGALRALHQHADDAQPQLDGGAGLPVGHPEGAARRLSRAHHPGHSPHHQRDQAVHPRHRQGRATWSSWRSAAPWATSRASRSSRRSASCGRTSAARTRSTST